MTNLEALAEVYAQEKDFSPGDSHDEKTMRRALEIVTREDYLAGLKAALDLPEVREYLDAGRDLMFDTDDYEKRERFRKALAAFDALKGQG